MSNSAILLDVDGVVVTGHKDGGRWDQNVARDFGISAEVLQERFFKPHWPAIMVGDTDMIAALSSVWGEFGSAATAQTFIDYWFAADSNVNEDVIALVGQWRARGHKAHLATNQERCRAKYLWETLDLSQHFDGMLYSADLKAQKPDAEFFRRAQERLGMNAKDIIFIDDRLENVKAATELGWRAIHYRSIQDLRGAL